MLLKSCEFYNSTRVLPLPFIPNFIDQDLKIIVAFILACFTWESYHPQLYFQGNNISAEGLILYSVAHKNSSSLEVNVTECTFSLSQAPSFISLANHFVCVTLFCELSLL